MWQLYQGASTPPSATPNRTNTATPTQDGPTAKRRKVGDVLATLVLSINEGPHEGRVIGLQVLNAVIHRYWAELHSEAQIAIRQAVVDLLNEDHVAIQSWAFLDLAAIAVTPQESSEDLIISNGSPASPSQQNARRKTEESDWSKVWAHGVRKASITPLSRAACHTAHVLLQSGRIPTASCVQDVSTLLQNVDIQGPPYPFDSVCAFLKSALRLTRSDLRLYAMDLEDKLLSWLAKWDALEGSRGKGRMDPQTPADLLLLLSESCRLPSISMHRSPVLDSLPDCAIVDHVLRQAETRSIRDFILYGRIPDTRRPEDENMPLASMPKAGSNRDLYLLEGPPQLATQLLSRNLRDFCVDWGASEQPAASLPERVRRSIDLVVLVLAFQACLELGGIRPDDDCNRMALDLLKRIQPCLAATPYTVSGQNLIWQGFEPLCYTRHRDSEIWPILLRPDIQSGVRQDILPPNRYETAPARYSVDADRKSGDHLQSVIWSVSAVRLRHLVLRNLTNHAP